MNEELIKIPQNAFIINLIQCLINTKINSIPFELEHNNEIILKDFNIKENGVEYKFKYFKKFKGEKERKEIIFALTFKDFKIDESKDIYYPQFTDKHLKMLLYILSKWENEFEFLVTEFNELCGLTKTHSKNIENNYKILEDILNVEIRLIEPGIDYPKEMDYYSILNIINKRNKVVKIKNVTLGNKNAIEIQETLSRAKIKITDLIDFEECGQMLIPTNLFKLKINTNSVLDSTSIAFNLLYLQAIKNNKNENTVTYNVSKILEWLGISEEDYYDFFKRNTKKTHTYYVSRLNKIFTHLAECGIKANFKNVKVKNKTEFFKKEQVIFDLTELKNLLKR